MRKHRLLVTALTIFVLCSVLIPLGAAATTAADGSGDGLSVSVQQDDEIIVDVTRNGTAVENATVNVTTVDNNESYHGADEEYTTDANGTVTLPTPEASVEVLIEASADGESDSVSTTLEPAAADLSISVTQNASDVLVAVTADGNESENATVTVSTIDENASYADTGTYSTDENGTVTLGAPTGNESVDVSFEATAGEQTAATTATLEPVQDTAPKNFGALVSAFIDEHKNESDGPLGLQVAGFVVEYNPGNAPDHAGPPSHAGPSDNETKSDQRGPPEHAGSKGNTSDDDNRRGPPEDAGNGTDKKGPSPSGHGNGNNGGGPPEHAGTDKR